MNVKLSKANRAKWYRNIVVFLAPLGVLYLTTIIGVISADGHLFSFKDLIPSTFAQGGMTLWVLNSALDYLRKVRS